MMGACPVYDHSMMDTGSRWEWSQRAAWARANVRTRGSLTVIQPFSAIPKRPNAPSLVTGTELSSEPTREAAHPAADEH